MNSNFSFKILFWIVTKSSPTLVLHVFARSQYIETRSSSFSIKEITLAKISCLLVAVFLFCHSIRWIPNIYEFQQGVLSEDPLVWPDWIIIITHSSHCLTVLNSSVNFYIYLFKHSRAKTSVNNENTRQRKITTTTTTQINLQENPANGKLRDT